MLLSSVAGVGFDPALAEFLTQAARRISPTVTVRVVDSVEAALGAPARDNELLALWQPNAAALAQAETALDATTLPRWAVLAVDAAAAANGAMVLPPEAWQPLTIEIALRATLENHRLRREQARLRGDLATYGSRIAHDLRTPLGGILTTAEMLREILLERDPANAALTQPILDSADGLARLIERTSSFAKAIASCEPAQLVDMGGPFWDAFQQMESRILQAGAKLTHPPTWPTISGHASWLRLIWRELLANTLQHAGAQPQIEAGWSHGDGRVRFWMRDSGEVPPAKRALLFRPFHRLSEPGAPRGFGLAIVRRLVEADGGACGFEALEAGGSLFHFSLPAAVEASPSAPAVPHPG